MAKLHMLKSVTDTINTSFILESGETLLVVDGGFPSEAPYMYEYLKSLGGHVDTWFITHIHDDHVGCLFTILNDYPDIRVDRVCFHFPSDEFAIKWAPRQDDMSTEEILRILREGICKKGAATVTAEVGDVYSYDGGRVTVRVLRTPDESITQNPINNSSTVYRFEADGKSILFLGDLGVEGGNQLLEITPPELLRVDYVQMSHHGQNGVSREVYEAIRAPYCLWPTPSWVWHNLGPGGYDTGIYQTIVVRGWISAMHCVKRHYLMIEGTQVISLDGD